MGPTGLAPFEGRKYLSLETRRRAGAAVATPVWFAMHGDMRDDLQDATLYVYSLASAGKVKRIRNDPAVRIAPCDIRGGLLGDWVPARARIVSGEEAVLGHTLLDRKYGWMKRIGGWISRLRRREYAVIAIAIVTRS